MGFLRKPSATFMSQVQRETARSTKSMNGRETAVPTEAEKKPIEELLYLEECVFLD
jgi:hypothetical protein